MERPRPAWDSQEQALTSCPYNVHDDDDDDDDDIPGIHKIT
jgi:hypothetical protein